MTTYSDTSTDLVINRLTKTQFETATGLDPTQEYHVDPEFTGGKFLETTSDGDIVESSQTIPTVNDPTITITQGGVTKGSFTLNQSTGDTIALDAGGGSVNTFDLFDHKWSDYQLNDQSWLRADTFSWQDGTVYSDAYNHLVDDLAAATRAQSETIAGITIYYDLAQDGHKIVPASNATQVQHVEDIYNATGVSWYYILDTANQRFKLPRENPSKEVVYTSSPLVIQPDGALNFNPKGDTTHVTSFFNNATSTGTTVIMNGSGWGGQKEIQYTRGLGGYADVSSSAGIYKGKKYLYFYVGQFSQSATEQTAGLNSELFNGKVDLDGNNATFAHIVETYSNGTSWYRVWSDGWCEQGGVSPSAGDQTNNTIMLLKSYKDTNYSILFAQNAGTEGSYTNGCTAKNKTTSSFVLTYRTGGAASFYWQACGYIN